jgi:lipopolysaccharide export system protein LptA
MKRILVTLIVAAVLTATAASGADQEMRIRSDSLKIEEASGKVTFTGNVSVKLEAGIFSCDSLVLETEPGDPSAIRKGTAEGNVVLTGDGEELRAGKAVIDMVAGVASFSGSPVLVRGSSQVAARSIIYNLDEGVAEFSGPIEASFSSAGEKQDQ